MRYAEPISRLIKAFSRLPGIGEKTAGRLALYVLNAKEDYVKELVESLLDVKENVRLCSGCMSFSEADPCRLCSDPSRDGTAICVVADYKDMIAIEAAGSFRGRYHVLHGAIAPLKGVGPDEIKFEELVSRVRDGGVSEVILATSFDAEGETTALYIKKALSGFAVKVSRIASGVPVGGSIEYMDPSTLGRAMDGRREA
ncbi:MAG TPA: recombination mediator RecR [Thermodesulfobacteriota bacterium]|nr:recombination mediator RecR [Thermodesulfobacteriota bacterium]